ncbi:MAG: GNAT family N-acetyltransferase [Marmoricola sp.]
MTTEDVHDLEIRDLTAADRDLLADLPTRVSPQSAIARFHGALTSLSEPLLDRLLDLDPGQREAIVALADGVMIAVARYARDGETDTAEIAVLVADAWQHRGLGDELLHRLTHRARSAGIARFRADMLATNTAARHLISAAGPVVHQRQDGGHVVLTVDITGTTSLPRTPEPGSRS